MSRRRDERPLQILITGRNILCHTPEERELLEEAKVVIENQVAADVICLDRLRSMYDACQRHALGKAQRALKLAIDVRTLPGPQ